MTAAIDRISPPGRPIPDRKLTYEEFLAWVPEGTHAEWVDGEVYYMSPVSTVHQRLLLFLSSVLGAFAELHKLGVVLTAPFQMKISPQSPGREPDLLFIAAENLERLKENRLDGPADLVVEIISPESGPRDRGDKFYEYESGGVPEYWLLDPGRQHAEVYLLDSQGRYRTVFQGRTGRLESAALKGVWVEAGWLWQDPLPSVLGTLRELKVID